MSYIERVLSARATSAKCSTPPHPNYPAAACQQLTPNDGPSSRRPSEPGIPFNGARTYPAHVQLDSHLSRTSAGSHINEATFDIDLRLEVWLPRSLLCSLRHICQGLLEDLPVMSRLHSVDHRASSASRTGLITGLKSDGGPIFSARAFHV
jgi:hypothetical protein